MDPNATRDTLKIGDYTTLKAITASNQSEYLSAEGIILDDVNACRDALKFDDKIFCVHLQRQYSASRELDSFLTTYNVDLNHVEDASTAKYLAALIKGRDNENKLNENYMKSRMGSDVVFGDIIQVSSSSRRTTM